MDEQRLAEIEARNEAAPSCGWIDLGDVVDFADKARQDVDDLLAEVRRLNALVDELTGYNQRVSANSTTRWQETCLLMSENERLRMMIQKAIDAPHIAGCYASDDLPCDCGRPERISEILQKALINAGFIK